MPTVTAFGAPPACALDVRLDALSSHTVVNIETLLARYPAREQYDIWYIIGRIDGALSARNMPGFSALRESDRIVAFVLSDALLRLAALSPLRLIMSERLLLRDALIARNAAIDGDHATVDAFARTWLGLNSPERWREAVEMALLGDWVERLGAGRASDPVLAVLIRQHACREHRQLQPLWERRTIHGQRVTLLSHSICDDLTLADIVTDRKTPETLLVDDEFNDTRIASVLGRLASPEREVARTWAYGGESWTKAAVRADRPAAYGERVRTKLKRLGKQHTDRAASAAAQR